MKITTAIPKNKILFCEENKKIHVLSNYKRLHKGRSFVDTECSSFNSRRDDISQLQYETIEEALCNGNQKIEEETKLKTIHASDINTISTIDSVKEIQSSNIFKRKTKNNKEKSSDLNDNLSKLKQERDVIFQNNIEELENIKTNHEERKNEKVNQQYQEFIKKKENIKEENKILDNNYRDEIKYLENKIQFIDEKHILKTEHERVIENLRFHFDMKKKILDEKIKYFTTIIKEKNELHHNAFNYHTFLSNLDITNFNINDSSIYESNQDNIYSSVVMKENNVIGNIHTIRPKFFSK